MNCPYCDNPIPPNVNQCPSCGAQVRQEFQQPQVPPYPQQPYPQQQYPQQQYPQQPYPPQYPPPYPQQLPPQFQAPPYPQQQFPPQQPYPQQFPPQFQQHYQLPISPKTRAAYIVLGVFGCLGIHNFHIGRVVCGLCQLVLSVLFVASTRDLSTLIIIYIWVFFELIFVTKDGQGRRLS